MNGVKMCDTSVTLLGFKAELSCWIVSRVVNLTIHHLHSLPLQFEELYSMVTNFPITMSLLCTPFFLSELFTFPFFVFCFLFFVVVVVVVLLGD